MDTEIKALVVDDSAMIRRFMIEALSLTGIHKIDQAADGIQALEAFSADDYGLVLMDWNMPNMTGIDAVRVIRSQGSPVPIIMVTTESERARILEAVKAGVNDYVMKPFTSKALAETIQNVFQRQTPASPPLQEEE